MPGAGCALLSGCVEVGADSDPGGSDGADPPVGGGRSNGSSGRGSDRFISSSMRSGFA